MGEWTQAIAADVRHSYLSIRTVATNTAFDLDSGAPSAFAHTSMAVQTAAQDQPVYQYVCLQASRPVSLIAEINLNLLLFDNLTWFPADSACSATRRAVRYFATGMEHWICQGTMTSADDPYMDGRVLISVSDTCTIQEQREVAILYVPTPHVQIVDACYCCTL